MKASARAIRMRSQRYRSNECNYMILLNLTPQHEARSRIRSRVAERNPRSNLLAIERETWSLPATEPRVDVEIIVSGKASSMGIQTGSDLRSGYRERSKTAQLIYASSEQKGMLSCAAQRLAWHGG